ncbi:MAG: nitrilase-related carbon-nitrogen hydrolase [Candidatus Binatia bacterium]
MSAVVRAFLAVALVAMPATAAVRLDAPLAGATETGGAVTVALSMDDPAEAAGLAVRVNAQDVTGRLRGTGTTRTLVLAGVPGTGAVLSRGRNTITVTGPGTAIDRRFTWKPGNARVHLVVVGNRIDFAAYESFATWQAEVDRIFTTLVVPKLVSGRPNVVLLTEDFGLPSALLGSRGATARAAQDADPLTGLGSLFVTYQPQAQFYLDNFTLPGTGNGPLARALTLALTDTLWRAFVPVLGAKAAAVGAYVVACTNVAPAHLSTDPADVAFFGDVDNPDRTDVFLPDGTDVYNTAFLWGPDGQLIGTTRKVNLTAPESDLLNLSNGALDDVQVFDTPAGRLGIAISLDAFTSEYVHQLDDLGATLVLQPDANSQLWAAPSATSAWQPDEWTESVLGMLRADLPNLTYNATSMMTGSFFPGSPGPDGLPTGIVFDGQSSVTQRGKRPPRHSFVGMAPGSDLTILGQPLLGDFVALAPWAFPDPGQVHGRAALDALRARCGSAAGAGASPRTLSLETRRAILLDCALSLLPGGANAGAFGESVVTADLRLPVSQ